MTKTLNENTGIMLRASVVVAAIASLGVWFNNRLSAVETSTVEVRKDIQYTQGTVLEMKADLKEVLNRLPPRP